MSCQNRHTNVNHTDRTGCRGACCRLFRGLGNFDKHWTTPAPGERERVDPASIVNSDGDPVMETIPVAGGVAWRFIPLDDFPFGPPADEDSK